MQSNGLSQNNAARLGHQYPDSPRRASESTPVSERRADTTRTFCGTELPQANVEMPERRGTHISSGVEVLLPGFNPVSRTESLSPYAGSSQAGVDSPRLLSTAVRDVTEVTLSVSPEVAIPALGDNPAPAEEVSQAGIVRALRNAVLDVHDVQPFVPQQYTAENTRSWAPSIEVVENIVAVCTGVGGITSAVLWGMFACGASAPLVAFLGVIIGCPIVLVVGTAISQVVVAGIAYWGITHSVSFGRACVKKASTLRRWVFKQPVRLMNWVAAKCARRKEVQSETAAIEALGPSHNRQLNCPISGERLANPVISPYGITYSRDSITEVLRQQGEAELIERFKTNHGIQTKLDGEPVQCCISREEFDASALSKDMSFPVVASDGHTYNYRSLVEMRAHHNEAQRGRNRELIRPMLSPLTRAPLEPLVIFQWALMSADECEQLARLLPAGATSRPLSLDSPPIVLVQKWGEEMEEQP